MGATVNRWIVIGVSAVIFAACSNGGASGPTGSTAATLATSTVAPTTAAATTSPPASTSPPPTTSTSTTTLPASTTTVLSTEDQIKQAVQDYFVAYVKCGQSPVICDPSSFTASQGPSRSVVNDLISGMRNAGLYFSDELRGSYLVAESVTTASAVEATAVYCVYDALIVLGPGGPDGAPTVVNDRVENIRYQYQLYLEDDVWRVGQQHELEHLAEGSTCPIAA